MTTADVSLQALRHVMDGDVAGAFVVLTEHIREADHPGQTMFAIVWGYASNLGGDDIRVFGGLSDDDNDLARTIIAAARTEDIKGAWLVWQMADFGSCGAVLAGLLAAAALSIQRRMGPMEGEA